MSETFGEGLRALCDSVAILDAFKARWERWSAWFQRKHKEKHTVGSAALKISRYGHSEEVKCISTPTPNCVFQNNWLCNQPEGTQP